MNIYNRYDFTVEFKSDAREYRDTLVDAVKCKADLTNAELKGSDFSGMDLSGMNFTGANLTGANFTGADLKGAKFAGACLNYVMLTQSQVSSLVDPLSTMQKGQVAIIDNLNDTYLKTTRPDITAIYDELREKMMKPISPETTKQDSNRMNTTDTFKEMYTKLDLEGLYHDVSSATLLTTPQVFSTESKIKYTFNDGSEMEFDFKITNMRSRSCKTDLWSDDK
jgi:hypothetical protein